jgi:signal transduction histidine kinase
MKSHQKPPERFLLTLLITAYLIITIFVLIAAPILSTRWLRLPFMGGFLTDSLRFFAFNNIIPDENWGAEGLNLGIEDHLLAIDDIRMRSRQEVNEYLSEKSPGETVEITVFSNGEMLNTYRITLIRLTLLDQFIYVQIPLILAAICFFCALWIFRAYQTNTAANSLTMLAASIAIVLGTVFDFLTTQRMAPLFFIGLGLSAASAFQLSMVLPRHNQFSERTPWIKYLAYPHNLALILLALIQFFFATEFPNFLSLRLLTLSLNISLGAAILSFILQSLRTKSPLIRQQSEVLLITTLSAALPALAHLTVDLVSGQLTQINPILLIPLGIFPISATISLLRYNLPQSNRLLTQTLFTVISLIVFAAAYTLIVTAINQILIQPISPGNPWMIGGAVFLVVLTLDPLRQKVQNIFTNLGYRQPISTQASTLKYAAALTTTNDKDVAVNLLTDAIIETLNPKHVYIFLYQPDIGGYKAAQKKNLRPQSPFFFSHNSPLATTLEKRKDPLYIENISHIPAALKTEGEKLSQLGSILYFPIPATRRILGWVAVGPKWNGSNYIARDIDLLGSMVNQFSVAYERAGAVAETRSRLQELETLNRIAIAVNTLNDMDSLLRSIYYHIHALIPINYFSLVMVTPTGEKHQHQFLMREGEIVISSRHPRSLEETSEEKQYLGEKEVTVIGKNRNLLIIPLKTEKRTIGLISIGISDPITTFDQINLSMIESIANLTTGAIIKTRLIHNLKYQTEQLTTLNQLSQQLSSTLALEPLLNNILKSALSILDCEAGSLLIADQENNELVFEVTAGPVAEKLLGERMPDDKGFAGQSYTLKKPIIANEVHNNPQWFKDTDEETGYRTQTLLVVPLMARGNPIGVLEVINKKTGAPFNENDQDLLAAFASQAAIAIENARLYTQTDQALEKRVDELFIMQQIDRELNTSRDINLALQVTLRSALSHVPAAAATIGLADHESRAFRNIWHLSRQNEPQLTLLEPMDLQQIDGLPLDEQNHFQRVHQPILSEGLGLDLRQTYHLIIHFRLEEDLFCLLILHLDSQDALDEDHMNFLERLVDHAAIALTGAVLYQNLHDAIAAKNEFISFISHELKNPLTAIKGYADLLADGTVGEVNETQEEFLVTINNNVMRMNTFITDLTDQAHIETKSLRLVLDATDIHTVVEEVLKNFNQQINRKSITVKKAIDPSIPDAWCDRLRLIQILSNLVSNAIKYTPKGGQITISAEHAANVWEREGPAEVIHFSISDTGYGIADEDQGHIFEKFFRGSDTRIKSIPGSGLGLIISKSLTEIMGGQMWFETSPGEGSTFHFTMPI